MIIVLSATPAELSSANKDEVEELFEEIIRSSYRGNHLIVINRQAADWAINHLTLSSRQASHLQFLKQEYTQTGSFPQAGKEFIQITMGSHNITRLPNGSWIVGHTQALKSNLLDPCSLLLENATTDGEMFSLMFHLEARKRGATVLNFRVENGGGSTILQELRRLALIGKAVICICDHDRLAPKDKTSKTFLRTWREAKSLMFIGKVLETPAREVKNFIPLFIVASTSKDYPAQKLAKLEMLLEKQGDAAPGDCLWLYFDIKCGLGSAQRSRLQSNKKAYNWVLRKYCLEEDRFHELDFPGFGDRVLESFLENGEMCAEFHRFSRSDYWQTHFSRWFDDFLDYFIARNPVRT